MNVISPPTNGTNPIDYWRSVFAIRSASRSSNATCPFNIFFLAWSKSNQSALSTSGYSLIFPEFFGHSIVKELLSILVTSRSFSSAQAWTIFPLGCLTSPNSMNLPSTSSPVSSLNSLLAASRAFSVSSKRPLGIDQAASSFLAQNGPPGWTSMTSSLSLLNLNRSIPELCTVIFCLILTGEQSRCPAGFQPAVNAFNLWSLYALGRFILMQEARTGSFVFGVFQSPSNPRLRPWPNFPGTLSQSRTIPRAPR